MSNTKPREDCCGDRYESLTKSKPCPCGCGLYYCRACEDAHLVKWARQELKQKESQLRERERR